MSTVDDITAIAGNAAVSYRIIDVTGQIKFSQIE